ncbi:hypothetical protein [Pelagicoccus sp. SDUM812002]|uniref:hypothetical protein n=1 Tax=Pelagicoccus sp. SDUM812002 TaxID=3041266 RepID=UPI0028104631|nr:hypothetical protein [Pelagicoccus sp. SDUM812002]MDQ8184238.1 hypothetical protein [Pelagicoccus sp. SDUM812002]
MKDRLKLILACVLLIAGAVLSGCASGNAGRNANIIGGSALGAALGHNASDGDASWTIGGAAIGAISAAGVNAMAESNEQQAYRNGYEAALNQSVKQQYWIIQNRQKEDTSNQGTDTGTFVPVVIPEQEIDGEITSERIIYLRTQ